MLLPTDLAAVKKEMVERDAPGLVEFVDSQRTLDDYHGQEGLKKWLRQDVTLWRAGDLKALPMGYLLCGPIGTGKTFLVECLAGEAGAPVVKLKNFRDKWVGSSEGNLEKIFRLIRALGRCIVFIDEADQTLGRRDSGTGDSGLVRPAVLDDRAGDVRHRQSRQGGVGPRVVAAGPHRGGPEAPRPRGRESADPADDHARGERRAHRRAGASLRADAVARRAEGRSSIAAAAAADAGRGRSAGGEGVSRGAHGECCPALPRSRAVSRAIRTPCPKTCCEFQMRLAVREATDLSFVPESLRHLAGDDPLAPAMSREPLSYLAAAFNARPFGMPIPPNWFALAAFGLLGAFVDPGFWLIGAGLEALYLWALVEQSALSGGGRRDRRKRRRSGLELAVSRR